MNAQHLVVPPRRHRLSGLLAAALLVPLAGLAGSVQAQAGPATYQASDLYQFMTSTPANGAVMLTRQNQGIVANISASGLEPGEANSVWWVIFNNPAACIDGCNGPDLANPAVEASVLFATGFVVGADGTASASARLASGEPPLGFDIVQGNGLKPGNGFGAEVHVVIRTHGPILPGLVAEQISTFGASCNPVCMNKQAAVFMPAL